MWITFLKFTFGSFLLLFHGLREENDLLDFIIILKGKGLVDLKGYKNKKE